MQAQQRLHRARAARLALRAQRDAAIHALYPHARTFVAVNLDAVDERQSAALAGVPTTLTLVTPDPQNPDRDHLFVGPHPVLSRDLRWEPDFEDLTFSTTGVGGSRIRGHLRLTHSRTRAFGSLHVAGVDIAVEYALAPQRYVMKLGEGAAYVSTGSGNKVMYDPASERWKHAPWGDEAVMGFRFGPEHLGRMNDGAAMFLQAEFDYIPAGTEWRPSQAVSSCRIDGDGRLTFELMSGARPIPSSGDTNLFPYQLRLTFDAFAEGFDGGMLTGANSPQGIAYGVKGVWAGGSVAGLYRLTGGDARHLIGVHSRELYVGAHRVPGAVLTGNRLTWTDLSREAVRESGLPRAGYVEFSADGSTVTASSFGVTGARVSPDEAEDRRPRPRPTSGVGADPYNLPDLINMTQFATNAEGMYFDEIQQKSMNDFYNILQYYMDPDLRYRFISVKPPVLSDAVRHISEQWGDKGSDPRVWYHSLGTGYVAQALAKWSDDPGAAKLNGTRAGLFVTQQSETSDVMAVQSPLLYQNQYTIKYQAKADWFLLDQRDPAKRAAHNAEIDAEIGRLRQQIRDDAAGTDDEKKKAIADLDAFATKVKDKELYWAFKLYSYALRPAYLNLLQSIIEDPTNDGSMFTQQVQRTVAQLTMLDGSNTVAEQYARLLQLFQVGSLLPQLVDYGGDLDQFNFAVKQIVDAFVKTYLNSPDPALREAAAQLNREGAVHNITVLLDCLRAAAAAEAGMYNWALVAERFSSLAKQRLGSLPGFVPIGILLAAVGLMINFMIRGDVRWKDLPITDQFSIITASVGVIAAGAIWILRRGVAIGELFIPGQGFWSGLKLAFGWDLMTMAQNTMAQGVKGWLLNTANAGRAVERLQFRAMMAAQAGNAAEAARLGRAVTRQKALTFVFGRNFNEFTATRLGAVMAVGGIIMSAILLHQGGEPIEVAVNALFLVASCLELIATAGAWGLAAAGVTTIGGMAVGSILAAVSVIGLVVMVAGFILMVVMMFRPQKSPVEKFAEESGTFYMPYKAAIDSFDVYQPLSQLQRSGMELSSGADVMTINSDGTVRSGKQTYTGHTAFYSRTDQAGRVQIAAPIRDAEGTAVLLALSTDDSGAVTTTNAIADNASRDPKLLWIAEIQGPGRYEETSEGPQLHSATFTVKSVYWADKGQNRYLHTDGAGGWKLGEKPVPITITMESMAPAGVQMSDIIWQTYQHDERRTAGIDHPGSAPRTWSVSPALPTGIELDKTDGTIFMTKGATIAPLTPTRFTLVVSNNIGSARAEFTLEVKAAALAQTEDDLVAIA